MTLFSQINGVTIPNPTNQFALVIFTLLQPPPELSMGWFMANYKTHKLSTRISDIEKRYNKSIVSKSRKTFTNRFGHESSYVVYTPCLTTEQYLEMYEELNK